MNKESRKREATRLRVQRYRAIRQKVDTTNPATTHAGAEPSTSVMNDGASTHYADGSQNFQLENDVETNDSELSENAGEQTYMQLNDNVDACTNSSADSEPTAPDEPNKTLREIDSSVSHSDTENEQSGTTEYEELPEVKQDANDEITLLRQWAMTSNIPQTQLDQLLKILRKRLLPDLPACAKTFLKTTSALYDIQKFKKEDGTEIGEFVYFGMAKHLQSYVNVDLHKDQCLKLQFNIDGLPLFKSSSQQFWPILCKVRCCPDVYAPFPVAVYAGNEKPNNLKQYLEKFIEELDSLLRNGIDIDSKNLKVQIDSFICDTPARAFVKCTKGHGGFYACERCQVRGERYANRTIYNSACSEERTNSSFRALDNPEHHNSVSPLTELDSEVLDMVIQFLLDFMHLVCLGVMKRLLVDCLLQGNRATRLSQTAKTLLSKLLITFQSQVPLDFQRTTRSISDISKWKATEFRFFLLYCGPIVLRKVLPDNLYQHFLLLHAACRILCSSDLACRFNDEAKAYLTSFVGLIRCYYGNENLVLNVHNLIHLADDAKNMQCSLSDITAFPFENGLGKMKKMLRSGNRPLAQLCRRMHESFFANMTKPTSPPTIEIMKARPAADSSGMININKFKYRQTILTTSAPNNTVLLHNGKIMRINDMIMKENKNFSDVQLIGHILKITKSIFTYPCDSAILKMWVVTEKVKSTAVTYPLKSVESKMVTFLCDDKLYTMPLLHVQRNFWTFNNVIY